MEFLLPDKISPYYSSVLGRLGAAASKDSSLSDIFYALNRQCTSSAAENSIHDCELDDPLGRKEHAVTSRLFRQYKNRCLLEIGSTCFTNCRFCVFRSHVAAEPGPDRESAAGTEASSAAAEPAISARSSAFITSAELSEACAFLSEHSEICEISILGGDPLSMPDEKLAFVFESIRKARPGILIRLYTRAPVYAPERITRETLALFRRYRPFWVVPHINHPAEISARWAPEAQKCLLSLIDAGIPLQADSTLLRGVNDSLPVLTELFTLMVHLGIKPGYLHQLTLMKGTSHFRIPLSDGVKLYSQLKKELSDLALPMYVLELPGGGGLVNIPATRFSREGDSWKYADSAGKLWLYPV